MIFIKNLNKELKLSAEQVINEYAKARKSFDTILDMLTEINKLTKDFGVLTITDQDRVEFKEWQE